MTTRGLYGIVLVFITMLLFIKCSPTISKDSVVLTQSEYDNLKNLDSCLQTMYEKIVGIKLIRVDATKEGDIDSIVVKNLIDGMPFFGLRNPGTRWSVAGYPHSISINFENVKYIDSVFINTFGWDDNYNHNITVFSWGDSIANFDTKSIKYSPHYLGVKTSNLLFQINSGKNNWTDIGDLFFIGVN